MKGQRVKVPHCESCATDLRYEGMGEWRCDCGESKLADWLDGPGLYEWIEGKRDLSRLYYVYPSFERRLRDWRREGCVASAYTVDKWLVEIGLHLSEVPDDLWREDWLTEEGKRRREAPNLRTAEEAKARRTKALARLKQIGNQREVAEEFGVTVRTIYAWREIERTA